METIPNIPDESPPAIAKPLRPWTRRLFWIIAIIAIVGGTVSGICRAYEHRPDWQSFAAESQYLWTHGQNAPGTAMFGYLPIVPAYLWPFAVWIPAPVGPALFTLTNVACAIWILRLLAKYFTSRDTRQDAMAWIALLGCVPLAHVIQSNQLTLWMLAPALAGITLANRNRPFVGGILIGFAGVIKLLPIILAIPLVLRRQWATLAGMLVGIIVFGAIPSILLFKSATIPEHQAWQQRVQWHSNVSLIENPSIRVYRRANQSLASVLTRWIRKPLPAQYVTVVKGDANAEILELAEAQLADGEGVIIDPMPPHDGGVAVTHEDMRWLPQFHVAELEAKPVKIIWLASQLVIFATLIALTLNKSQSGQWLSWNVIAAVWLIAMVVPSPMFRHYYLSIALPALAIVIDWLVKQLTTPSRRWTLAMRFGSIAVWVWIIGLPCIGIYVARWYGLHWVVLLAIGIATLWTAKSADPSPHTNA